MGFKAWLKETFFGRKTVFLLRYESAEGWDLLGIYTDIDAAQEGLLEANRDPQFGLSGSFSLDPVPVNCFWPMMEALAGIGNGRV